jgi:prepilin-type N-terminal cleavage/methylation domain-containing protein
MIKAQGSELNGAGKNRMLMDMKLLSFNKMTNNKADGFSLVELMVALVVGALMAHALLSAQHYSLNLASYNKQTWENLNLTQELFVRHGINELSRPSGTWIALPDNPDAKWRTLQNPGDTDNISWIEMDTDYNSVVLHWSWPLKR